MITDLMNENEKKSYKDFIEKHKKCICNATIGGKISVEVTATGLGSAFVCKCNVCGEKEDITDVGSW
jgi:hypothetical protein